MSCVRFVIGFCVVAVLSALGQSALASGRPAIAIIIDDLGNNRVLNERAIHLPGPVACSFLPHTPYAARLARRAHRAGKEVLLHLPMQPIHHLKLGPGGLTLHMTRHAFDATVRSDLAAVPDVDGVNNHMGSLMTRHPGDMAWLMAILHHAGVFFVDSRTIANTVAYRVAREHDVAATSRDVFLDDVQSKVAIVKQLKRLVAIARRRGSAVAIGHPYPITLRVLKGRLPALAAAGVKLVPVRRIIARQAQRHADSGN
jgi:polysaccharide deacetylase 2 family uncharacterized protein YibQ